MDSNASAAAAPPAVVGKKRIRPAEIGNKIKRSQVYNKQKYEKKKEKSELRRKRQRAAQELGDAAPPKQVCTQFRNR